MQQLASAALKSQRPPLALLGWIQSVSEPNDETSPAAAAPGSSSQLLNSNSSRVGMLSSIGSSNNMASATSPKRHEKAAREQHHLHLFASGSSASSSGVANPIQMLDEEDNDESYQMDNLASEFQSLLQTRRTGTSFLPRDSSPRDATFYSHALERAVRCAIQAPNHKRTEPVTFKRMIAPSERTHRLADIAYETHLQRKLASLPQTATDAERSSIQSSVMKKREKWDQIPAFLVTLVKSNHSLVDTDQASTADLYQPLAYSPPTSERELEDYATACTAVQNCLLSLHAEHVATKWVTGPVVQTRAFRKLVQATEHDRVVALIMVGQADESKRVYPRRMRREFHGDVLVDL
jgi:nitroreductase